MRGSLLRNIPWLGYIKYGGVFYRGCHDFSPSPGEKFAGIPYWDVGEIGEHGHVLLLPHAALPLTQVTHVRSREDLKGNAVTLR